MSHHTFGQFTNLAGVRDRSLGEKTLRLGAIKSGMHAGDILEQLRNSNPARQHRNIGNEADIPHELIALCPGIASQYPQFALIGREAENRVERRRFAGPVWTD